MRRLHVLVALGLVASLPLAAIGQERISGSCTASGQTTPLNHVYAFWAPRDPSSSKSDLHVLFTDEIIPAGTIPSGDEGVHKMAQLVQQNKVHAVELHFDGAGRQLFDGEQAAVYIAKVSPGRHGANSPGLHFDPAQDADPGKVSGKFWLDKESADLFEWSCKATFEVAVPAKR
jgi:hypothetical protein